MKVLLLSPIPPPAGGIATWTKLYLNSAEAKDNEIEIIDTSVAGNRVENYDKRSIKEEIIRSIKIISGLRANIKKNKYDIVHINTSCSKYGMIRDYLCAKFSKWHKVGLIIHCHCDTSYMVKGKVSEYIFNLLCGVADKIFCLNTSSYEHIKKITKKESIIIPNFIDLNTLEKNDFRVSNQIKNIIYVGHIVLAKGCYEIISVAKQLPEINFIMIGYLSEEIKRIPTTSNVKFIGEVSKNEVFERMLDADLLLFPTHTEGFPNVVLEAMACGLPIISTPVGAIPDMIEDKGGLFVEIGDVGGIMNAIKKLNNKDIRIKMSNWNKEKVKNSYTVTEVSNRIFKEYSQIQVLK